MEMNLNGYEIRIFSTMASYLNGNRMMYMDIETTANLGNSFVKSIKPIKDSAFEIFEDDKIIIGGECYVRIDMCECDYEQKPAYLCIDALNQEVFQIYERVRKGYYECDNTVFETKEAAELFMKTFCRNV